MADVVDHLKVMNNALARIGAGAIMAEDEDSDLAQQVVAMYYDRLDAVLGMHPWIFAGKTYKLDRLAEIEGNDFVAADGKFMNGYRHGFTLPGTRVGHPRRILDDPRQPDNPCREFLIEGANLYADRAALWATVTVRADPPAWASDFRLAFTAMLAADLCVPVTHDAGLAEQLRAAAEGTPSEGGRGGLIGRAMGKDAGAAPAKAPLWGDPLTIARMS